MTRTYLDASVLIAAFRGQDDLSNPAISIITDRQRVLVVSDYLSLEVLPQPVFHKREDEEMFMKAVVESAGVVVASSPEVAKKALQLACAYNLSPMDALHAGAAIIGQADELVTLEKPGRPLFNLTELKVVSLHTL